MKLTNAYALIGLFIAVLIPQSDAETRMKRIEIMDRYGFERPLIALHGVIPADWSSQGEVVWNQQGECQRGQRLDWRAVSPDGRSFFAIFPTQVWQYNTMGFPISQDCIRGHFESADQFAQAFMQQFPDGRVLDVFRDNQIMAQLGQLRQEIPGDPYSITWMDSISARVGYTENGTAMHGILLITSMHSNTTMGHSYGQPVQTSYGATWTLTMFGAPQGEFDRQMGEFHIFASNLRPGAEWQRRMTQHNNEMRDIYTENMQARTDAILKANSDAADLSMQSWRRRNAMSDRSQRERIESIRGVETYRTSSGSGQIELPFGYDHVWEMPDDTFILTDDAFLKPVNGTKLNRVP